MKCPCYNCITFPICRNSEQIGYLFNKCPLVLNFIQTKEQALEIIKLIQPTYYTSYVHTLAKPVFDQLLEDNSKRVLEIADNVRNVYNDAHRKRLRRKPK